MGSTLPIPDLVPQIVGQLRSSKRPFFQRQSEAATHMLVANFLECLNQPRDQRISALRTQIKRLFGTSTLDGVMFQDLRTLCQTIRTALLDSYSSSTPDPDLAEIRLLEDWCSEMVLTSALQYSAQRDIQIKDQSAQLEIKLSELRAAQTGQETAMSLLREVWVPISVVFDGVLLVPLLGSVDMQRAQEITEEMLAAITRERARFVMLDVSGIPMIDTAIAHALIKMGQSVQLLGTRMVMVGITPEIAQTIVQLGIDLSTIQTEGTLQEGLRSILRYLGYSLSYK